jgi:hypothetical protein
VWAKAHKQIKRGIARVTAAWLHEAVFVRAEAFSKLCLLWMVSVATTCMYACKVFCFMRTQPRAKCLTDSALCAA